MAVDTEKMLLKILRAGLFDSGTELGECPLSCDAQWSELRDFAKFHRLDAVVRDILLDNGWIAPVDEYDDACPDGCSDCSHVVINGLSWDQRVDWAMSAGRVEADFRHIGGVYADLEELFSRNGSRFTMLKGLALSELYPVPMHRRFTDIDLFFPDGIQTAEQAIKDRFGVAVVPGPNHHDRVTIRGVVVELHRELFDIKSYRSGMNVHSMMLELYGTDPVTFGLVYIVRHAASHFAGSEISWANIVDIGLYIKRHDSELKMDEVIRICRRCGFGEFFLIVMDILVNHMGLKVSTEESASGGGPLFRVGSRELTGRVMANITAPSVYRKRRRKSLLHLVLWFRSTGWKRSLADENEGALSAFLRLMVRKLRKYRFDMHKVR